MGMMLRYEDTVALKCVSKFYISKDTVCKIVGSEGGFIFGIIYGENPNKIPIRCLIENYLKR